jgi:hypothetical protein
VAIDVLKEDSRSSTTDYIVASHLERLNLIRIRNGATLEIGDICAIGDSVPFRDWSNGIRMPIPRALGQVRSSIQLH